MERCISLDNFKEQQAIQPDGSLKVYSNVNGVGAVKNLYGVEGPIKCNCKEYHYLTGFTRYPRCRHIKKAFELYCGWIEGLSKESQTKEGICPRCGKETKKITKAERKIWLNRKI